MFTVYFTLRSKERIFYKNTEFYITVYNIKEREMKSF